MSDKKRDRASNFDKTEVQLLMDVIYKYRHIIENKKTDAVTNKEKEVTWQKITTTFNSSAGQTTRSAKTLKLKYESLKKQTKKKAAQQRQEMYKTGGGTSNTLVLTDIDERVMGICSNMTGLNARYDSDTITDICIPIMPEHSKVENDIPTVPIYTNQREQVETNNELNEMDFELENIPPNQSSSTDDQIKGTLEQENVPSNQSNSLYNDDQKTDKAEKWLTWTPKSLKTKVTPALKPTKAGVCNKIDKLSDARLELVELQKELTRRELSMKIEELELHMQHLKNEERRRQEIHDLTMHNLRHGIGNDIDK